MKLLRTIRLDPSDSFVFERAAAAGEWAVPGGFEFWDKDPHALVGRPKQAFRAGFLGLGSFGWSTLVVAVEANPDNREAAIAALAGHLIAAHGAPDLASARLAAAEEVAYAANLAEHPAGTLIAMHRTIDKDGNFREQFRTLKPAEAREAAQMPCSAGAFGIVEDDGALAADDGAGPAGGADVDLVDLAQARSGGKRGADRV